MKNRKDKGISLITLVITIVVIIILAAAVVLTLNKNNPINDAKRAKVLQSIDTFKSDLELQVASRLLKDNELTIEDINSKDEVGLRIEELIPSIANTEYASELVVVKGKLRLKDNSNLSEEIKSIVKEALGEKIITKEIIKSNVTTYIGKSVVYTGYSESTNNIEWKIFGFDEEGNILLKANEYINLNYKISSYPSGISKGQNNDYEIFSTTNRDTLVNYIGNQENWKEFSVEGKTTARGAMTLQEYVEGYNLVNQVKLSFEQLKAGENTSDGQYTAASDGFALKLGEEKYRAYAFGLIEMYNKMKFYDKSDSIAKGMWLSSNSSYDTNSVLTVRYSGYVYYNNFSGSNGICPVVSVNNGKLIEMPDGSLTIE